MILFKVMDTMEGEFTQVLSQYMQRVGEKARNIPGRYGSSSTPMLRSWQARDIDLRILQLQQ